MTMSRLFSFIAILAALLAVFNFLSFSEVKAQPVCNFEASLSVAAVNLENPATGTMVTARVFQRSYTCKYYNYDIEFRDSAANKLIRKLNVNSGANDGSSKPVEERSFLLIPQEYGYTPGSTISLIVKITGYGKQSASVRSAEAISLTTPPQTITIKTPKIPCKLTSAEWSKDEVVVGEAVSLLVKGENCQGWNVSFNIREVDYTPSDLIGTIVDKFAVPERVVGGPLTFTKNDYQKGGNERGYETMEFEAVAGTSTVRTAKQLKLLEPVEGTCQLSSLQWSGPVRVGSPVNMSVLGSGCPNYKVNIRIYADDFTPDDEQATVDTTFNTQGTGAVAAWIPTKEVEGYPVYFVAAAANAKKTSPETTVLAAQTGGGTGTSGGSTSGGTVRPGGSQTIDFSIFNPLKVKSFEELVQNITGRLIRISIPIAVVLIIYAGFLIMTSGTYPNNYKKGGNILKWTLVGEAVILIGHGFVTLIKSILGA